MRPSAKFTARAVSGPKGPLPRLSSEPVFWGGPSAHGGQQVPRRERADERARGGNAHLREQRALAGELVAVEERVPSELRSRCAVSGCCFIGQELRARSRTSVAVLLENTAVSSTTRAATGARGWNSGARSIRSSAASSAFCGSATRWAIDVAGQRERLPRVLRSRRRRAWRPSSRRLPSRSAMEPRARAPAPWRWGRRWPRPSPALRWRGRAADAGKGG